MKNRLNIIVLLAILFVSCSPHDKGNAEDTRDATFLQQLTQIDLLMWQQPDSALMQLLHCGDGVNIVPTTEQDRHYYQLLLAELLYKNDSAQANRTELCQAVTYFDSLVRQAPPLQRGAGGFNTTSNRYDNLFFLAARAHYINGVGYYEQDSIVKACAEYLKALDVMGNHFREKELVGEKAHFMAMTYTRLTVLFSNLYLNKQAIYFGKQSLSYYEKSKTSSWHLPWMLSKIGTHYNMMEQLDSADYYYQRAMSCLPDTTNKTYRDLVSQQALLSYQTEHQYEKSIKTLLRMVYLATSDQERLARYLSIADVYYNELQFDSAKVYFEKVYCDTRNPDNRMLAADRLREVSLSEGDSLKVNEYALARSQFTTEKDEEGNLNSDLTTLCLQYEQGRQEVQHRLKTQRTARRWSFVMGMAILVVAVTFFMLMVLKRRIRSEQYLHKIEQAALSGKLKKSNETLRELKGQIKRQGNMPPKPEEFVTFADEPICRLIWERVNNGQFKSQMDCTFYKEYALNKEQLQTLREVSDRHFDQFTIRLAKAYPELTRSDLNYCCLYLLGLTDADIAALMQRAYNTINERNSKLKTIFESENALTSTLLDFANKNTFS